MVALSIARSTRSGTLVGPGICRKCRPLGRALRDIRRLLGGEPRVPREVSCAPMDRPPPSAFTVAFHPRVGDSALARRLSSAVDGGAVVDAASRGRYSTDASIYQIEPIGIVVPRT